MLVWLGRLVTSAFVFGYYLRAYHKINSGQKSNIITTKMRFGVTVNIFIAASFLFLSGFAGNAIASAVEEEDGKTGKVRNTFTRFLLV